MFHKWVEKDGRPYGIVEWGDGHVNLVNPTKVCFERRHGKLIDADALIESLSINPYECPGCPEPEYLEEIITLLETAPEVGEAD